jgi:hypothetical protein
MSPRNLSILLLLILATSTSTAWSQENSPFQEMVYTRKNDREMGDV